MIVATKAPMSSADSNKLSVVETFKYLEVTVEEQPS